MTFLKEYVTDWMNRDDEKGPENEQLGLYFRMIEKTENLLKEALQEITNARDILFDLDDAYARWGSVYRELYFRRGFALVYQSTTQHTSYVLDSDAVAIAIAHTHMLEYTKSEIFQRELSSAEQAVIQEEQGNIRRLQRSIYQQATNSDEQLISCLLQEMERLYMLLFQSTKETYFTYGMLHGYRLFSALLAEIGSPCSSPLAKQCG
ncbi:hypothetical protein [Paenibacillus sp. PDC88]|uniref:hypothetical protein n=1 Tax=Paenibacillus TaxID=44249 RepID=UPI00089826F0|nr:hypothetical protein [Paenibacillus sp. PDC88]SDX82605.1 hypothetical protein SAMN05518848_11815 [Paenibacillus sp. PDC88]